MRTHKYDAVLHTQKIIAAWYSIPTGTMNQFQSREAFLNWANDPEHPNSLRNIIDFRFFGDNAIAVELCLTRIDNEQPYSPDNCTWATRSEVNERKQNTRLIRYQGIEYTINEFCAKFGVKRYAITYQIRKLGLGNITDKVLDAVIAKQQANTFIK